MHVCNIFGRIQGSHVLINWWWIHGCGIWQRWWYMVAVVVYGYGSVVVYGYGLVVVYGYGFKAVADKQWW